MGSENFNLLSKENIMDSFLYLSDKYRTSTDVSNYCTYTLDDKYEHHIQYPEHSYYNTMNTTVDRANKISFFDTMFIDVTFQSTDISTLTNLLEDFKSVINKYKGIENSQVFFGKGSSSVTMLFAKKIGVIVNLELLVGDIKKFNRNSQLKKENYVIHVVSINDDDPTQYLYIHNHVIPYFKSSKKSNQFIYDGKLKPFLIILPVNGQDKNYEDVCEVEDFKVVDSYYPDGYGLRFLLLSPKNYQIYD